MNLRPWLPTALLLLALPAHAAGPLKRTFSFDEKSRDALLIVEVAPQKTVEQWTLSLNEYSLESKGFIGGMFKGFSMLQHIDGQEESPRYFAGVLKRGGTHIVYGLITQGLWGACFDKGAQAFTFEPGKVYYLGAVDPNDGLKRIVTELPRSARIPYWVYGMTISHTAPAEQEGWEQDVTAFIAQNLPKVKAPLLAAEGVEVTFKPGTASAGNPMCRANNG